MGKRFAAIVIFDVVLCYSLALWVVFGNTTAETVFKAYFWATVPLSIMAYLAAPGALRDYVRSPWWFVGYARGVRIVAAVFLVLAQEVTMLAALIAAWIAFEAALRYCIDKEGKTP